MNWSRFLLKKLWHHLRPSRRRPWGLQKQQKQDQPELALPLEEEDEKSKIGGPTKESITKYQQTTAKHKKTKNKEVDIDEL
jgi:hypothetical protein